MNEIIQLIVSYPNTLLSRDAIIDLVTNATLNTREEMIANKMVYTGKLFTDNGVTHVVTKRDGNEVIEEKPTKIKKTNKKLISFQDKFTLEKGMIDNYDGPPVKTTFGRFLLNYALLVKPFGNVIPYVNTSPWNISKIEDDMIAVSAIDDLITAKQIMTYIDNAYFIGSYSDFCVPAMSEKSITSNPKVNKLRKELLEKYKDQLDDPKIMMLIEDKLIALDKKELAGDSSNGFMIKAKNYNVQRKRMFLSIGMVDSFGDDERGYEFVKTNLNDGWDPDDFDVLANDIRRGSYHRAKTTAKGGAESKFLGRTFQESRITIDDCKTKRGVPIKLTENNHDEFLYRNMIEGNKLVEITRDNVKKYIGKTVLLRSPMFCTAKNGYCYHCMDMRFKKLNIKLLNTLPINIGSAMLSAAMAAMHGTKLETFSIDSLDEFLV